MLSLSARTPGPLRHAWVAWCGVRFASIQRRTVDGKEGGGGEGSNWRSTAARDRQELETAAGEARGGPLRLTGGEREVARKWAELKGCKLPDQILHSATACRHFITQCQEAAQEDGKAKWRAPRAPSANDPPPSEKQMMYAKRIEGSVGVEIPKAAIVSRVAMTQFISQYAEKCTDGRPAPAQQGRCAGSSKPKLANKELESFLDSTTAPGQPGGLCGGEGAAAHGGLDGGLGTGGAVTISQLGQQDFAVGRTGAAASAAIEEQQPHADDAGPAPVDQIGSGLPVVSMDNTAAELCCMLKAHKLPSSGNKSQMIQRLVSAGCARHHHGEALTGGLGTGGAVTISQLGQQDFAVGRTGAAASAAIEEQQPHADDAGPAPVDQSGSGLPVVSMDNTAAELRCMLKAHKLPSSGNKSQMIQRLVSAGCARHRHGEGADQQVEKKLVEIARSAASSGVPPESAESPRWVSQGHLAPTGSPAREEGGPPNKPTNRNSSEGPIIVHSREARNSSHSAGTECSRETPAAPGAQPAPATPDEVAEKLTKQRRSATPINQKISDEV